MKYLVLASVLILASCKDVSVHNKFHDCVDGFLKNHYQTTHEKCLNYYKPYIEEESLKEYNRCTDIFGVKGGCLSRVTLYKKGRFR